MRGIENDENDPACSESVRSSRSSSVVRQLFHPKRNKPLSENSGFISPHQYSSTSNNLSDKCEPGRGNNKYKSIHGMNRTKTSSILFISFHSQKPEMYLQNSAETET